MISYQVVKNLTAWVLFSVLIVINSEAQFSTPTTIRTPYGNQTIWTPNSSMRFYNYNQGFVNRKHNFTIVLLNDSSFEVKAKINIEEDVNSIKWGKGEDQHKVVPSETKEIYRIGLNGKIRGIPKDSCWIFLVKQGKISTYSVSSETDYPLINYIQKGEGGEMLPLLAMNVEDMVSDNEKALTLAKKGKLMKAIERYNQD